MQATFTVSVKQALPAVAANCQLTLHEAVFGQVRTKCHGCSIVFRKSQIGASRVCLVEKDNADVELIGVG